MDNKLTPAAALELIQVSSLEVSDDPMSYVDLDGFNFEDQAALQDVDRVYLDVNGRSLEIMVIFQDGTSDNHYFRLSHDE